MYSVLLVIHILAAVLLVTVILIQRGRGGGLVESFSGVESMFGTKTNQFLTKATAILASLFLFTSVSLALIAARQTRSLINNKEAASSAGVQTQAQEPLSVEQADEPVVPEKEALQEEGSPN